MEIDPAIVSLVTWMSCINDVCVTSDIKSFKITFPKLAAAYFFCLDYVTLLKLRSGDKNIAAEN